MALMSVEQLLDQADDEYMSVGQLAFFKNRLELKAAELRDRLLSCQASCEIERHPDEADFASDEEHRAMAASMIERDRQTLNYVRKALEILALGDYGFCQETGEAIGLKRLLLVPESLYSVESMRVLEAKGMHLRQVA
ncbi:TraR/DksA family transcriptional regulator [Pseudomonas fluorescens]|uniref:RNA polymerase-binding transcription factor DksA n=1 Tax=Pseudomonas fluorescens TaxID=294 RepID=A0A5E7PC92_PSEFL|nr:TraR/DksA family transcriptional regulator [Pseudomonas fluorescens]VVP44983.1 RNA polymerase-binding transcription factor DksA [Pseudomonas fluorescens]